MDFSRRSFYRSSSSSGQASVGTSGATLRKVTKQSFYAPSVYGGAGGQGTRISSTSYMANYGGGLSGDFSVGNEKITMQNLNDRLASYLERVHSLEQTNSQLEIQIRQWYEKNSPTLSRDYSTYFKTIEDLRNQIKDARLANTRCMLQLDNSKLAAEDFRVKYETEHGMRMAVEADLHRLHKVFDDLTLQKTDLEIQIESLTEELAFLKKAHKEDVANLQGQLGKTVKVEVDAAPSHDLGTIMNEMRQKYESLAQKNLQEAKEQFEKRVGSLQLEVQVSTSEIKTNEAQVTELRRTYQNLEIDLQSHYSMKESLERSLDETKARYSSQLAQIQALINTIEAQLMQVRYDTERQNEEYNALLDVKTRLEMEIATYRRLLEGEDVRPENFQLNMIDEREIKKTRKIKTVVEEVVDGKVVSSQVKEMEETL
ncbi:keratin, type I cytoskeletal 20 [Phascolarctos cinereus]|uniref:Keratin, type I cytoskeletal 20 n=1 Tax=Phascolarctos cinereus TaxID=38626 RepID=A0A6P5L550_PHACI|nr:keratin, type I cytoskeletal 20 [Phascolarctos cinereus]